MIKTTGFRPFLPRNVWGNSPRPFMPATLFRTAEGFERVIYSVRTYGWAFHFRASDFIGNLNFRKSQLGWRSYMGKAPSRRV